MKKLLSVLLCCILITTTMLASADIDDTVDRVNVLTKANGASAIASISNGQAENLFDGNTVDGSSAYAWSYTSGSEANARIDLGNFYDISAIKIYLGTGFVTNVPTNFTVLYATEVGQTNFDKSTFTEIKNFELGVDYDNSAGGKREIEVEVNEKVRYIMISVPSASQTRTIRFAEVEAFGKLVGYANGSFPSAENCTLTGYNTPGSILSASYVYSHTGGYEFSSDSYKWYRVSPDGAKTLIEDAVSDTYIITEEDLGFSICCSVTVTDENGIVSDETFSDETATIVNGVSIRINEFNVSDDGIATYKLYVSKLDGKSYTVMLWAYSGADTIDYQEQVISNDTDVTLKTVNTGSDVYAIAMIVDTESKKPIFAIIKNPEKRPIEDFDNSELKITPDPVSETFTLYGIVEAWEVYFTVTDENGTVFVSASDVMADGKLYKQFKFPQDTLSGNYIVKLYFSSDAEDVTLPIFYSRKADKQAAFDRLKETTTGKEAAAVLKNNEKILEITDKYVLTMSSEELEELGSYLAGKTYTNDEIHLFYNDLRYRAALLTLGKGGEQAYEVAQYYEDVFDFKNTDMYEEYLKLKAPNKVFAMYAKTPESREVARTLFEQYTLLAMINEAESYGIIENLIGTYSEKIPFSLNVYNQSDKTDTSVYLFKNGGNYTSMALLEEAIKNAYEAQNDDVISGGSGSVKGSGGSLSSHVTRVEISDNALPTAQADTFADVPSNHWAAEYIDALKERGIVSGDEQGRFNPENEVTREEFVKMLIVAVNKYDKTAKSTFTDLANCRWADSYIASAVNGGIIEGLSDTEFGAGRKLSRQDMALMIFRALSLESGEYTVEFSDDSEISEYARSAVKSLASAGIISGFEDGSFCPNDTAKRCEAAKLIYMVYEKLK